MPILTDGDGNFFAYVVSEKLPMDLSEVALKSYELGVSRAVLRRRAKDADSIKELGIETHDKTKAEYRKAYDANIPDQVSWRAFCIGYIDTILMLKSKPDIQQRLLSLSQDELTPICQTLAYTWYTNTKWSNQVC